MSDQTLLTLILVAAAVAFAIGIWAGLGYPGLYEKYEKTGKAPRESPLSWLSRGGRRRRTSEQRERDRVREEEEDEAPTEHGDEHRPRFDRGLRFRR